MSHFLAGQQDYIFFLYGAAFLGLIPVCLFLRSRFSGQMAWTLVAWFGAAHGLNEWLAPPSLSLGLVPALDLARFLLLASSFVHWAEFGRANIARMEVWVPCPWILAVPMDLAGHGGFAGVDGLFAASRYVLGCGGGTWEGWSSFGAIDVRTGQRVVVKGLPTKSLYQPRDWHDTWTFRFGMNYRWNDRVKLRAGYSYDLSAIPNATFDPMIINADQHIFTVGFDVRLSDL